jgi:hypothetical protein
MRVAGTFASESAEFYDENGGDFWMRMAGIPV